MSFNYVNMMASRMGADPKPQEGPYNFAALHLGTPESMILFDYTNITAPHGRLILSLGRLPTILPDPNLVPQNH